MTLNEIFLRLCDIDHKAQTLIEDAGFDYKDGFGFKVCPDPIDPEERFLRDVLEELLVLLEDLHKRLDYLKAPSHGKYQLKRLPNGRYGYCDENGIHHAFNCGSPVEAMILDAFGQPLWIRTRIEHDGNDYFLWQHDSVALDGLTIRERGR